MRLATVGLMFVDRALGGRSEAWTTSWMRRLISSWRSTGSMAHDGLPVPGCERWGEDLTIVFLCNGDYGREWDASSRGLGKRDASKTEWGRWELGTRSGGCYAGVCTYGVRSTVVQVVLPIRRSRYRARTSPLGHNFTTRKVRRRLNHISPSKFQQP